MTASLPGGGELVLDSHRERASGARHRSGHVRDTRRVRPPERPPRGGRGQREARKCGPFSSGETRTRTGDTTIFRRRTAPVSAEEKTCKSARLYPDADSD